ncbi:T11L1-like protein [Mya arenaria]|uniref:T11L1-like protein n=1 Tax=Mya arenaria TaxID=6604 RepID=A0ABY7EIR0_MYAAR|nr:T11L1-like protein [Mya arenaria]
MAEGGENPDKIEDSLSAGNEEVDTNDKPIDLSSSAGQKRLRLQQSPTSNQTPFMVPPSPPRFVSLDELMEAASGVKNMSLCHEIAVDANFEIKKVEPPKNSLEGQVKEIIHKAFWDAFEAKISEDPPDFSHTVVLIKEVKEMLMSLLLPQHNRIKAQVEEVLDTDLIQQKLDNDAFDIYYYADYVINLMAKLCAPARDDRIAKIKEMKNVVPLFKEILEVLDVMKMDLANFTIQQMRPYIQQQSVDYERIKFEEFCEKQRETALPGGENQASLATPAAILNGAYMEVLEWDLNRLFPETLVLDQGRLMSMRDQTQRITMVTSVLLVTYNTVGQSIQGVNDLKVKLKDEIRTLLDADEGQDRSSCLAGIAEQVTKNVLEFHLAHSFPTMADTQQRTLKGQITGLADNENPVINLMGKRILSFIQSALFSRHAEPLKLPVGMSVMEQELSQLCGQFLRIISHNRAVFSQYYTDIINDLLERHKDLSPVSS